MSTVYPFKITREIKVWLKKEKDEEDAAITTMYLNKECQNYFGHYHNRDAKKLGFAFVSRKDVGAVPVTITITGGHD